MQLACPGELVLGSCREIVSVVALMQLIRRLSIRAVDDPTALDRRSFKQGVGPADDVAVVLYAQELSSAVQPALHQPAVPRKDRNIGNRVSVARDVFRFGQPLVEYVELTFHLHGETVDRVFDLGRRVGIEMTEAAAEI